MLLKRSIYDVVDANESTSTHYIIKAKCLNSCKFVNVALYSKDKHSVKFLKKPARYDFLVNEIIKGLNGAYGY